MEPPIQTEYFLSGGAMILILMVSSFSTSLTSLSSFLVSLVRSGSASPEGKKNERMAPMATNSELGVPM